MPFPMEHNPPEPRVTWLPDPKKAWPTQKMLDRIREEVSEDCEECNGEGFVTRAFVKRGKSHEHPCPRCGSNGNPHGPGYQFAPDGLGGGLLTKWSKTTFGWRLVGQVLPHGA